MALEFTEKFRLSMGGKTHLFLSVAQDQATSTFTAASVGMTYIDFAGQLTWNVAASGAANASVMCGYLTTSVISDGTVVEQGVPMQTGSTKQLLLIGW